MGRVTKAVGDASSFRRCFNLVFEKEDDLYKAYQTIQDDMAIQGGGHKSPKCGNAKAVSASPDIEVTAGTHSPPRCLPGYCVPDTGCQKCEKDGWIGGAPRSCNVVNKKRYERHCDFWARRGHCKDRFRRFMNYWCPKSCQC